MPVYLGNKKYSSVYVGTSATSSAPEVEQATPVISIDQNGLIEATSTQEGGAVRPGTKSSTLQLETMGAIEIAPDATGSTTQTSGKFMTGDVTVLPVQTEGLSATANGIFTPTSGKFFDTVSVSVPAQGGAYNVTSTENGDGTQTLAIADADGSDRALLDSLIDRTISGHFEGNVTSIGNSAFSYCSNLTSVSLPLATSIGNHAFYYCSKLTSAPLPLATSIGEYAFSSCSKLTDVSIPLATSIGSHAFFYCYSLTSVSLPSATSIGNSAFYRCSNLTDVWLSNTSQVCTYGTTNASYDPSNANLKIHVPESLIDQYRVATNWVRLADKFVPIEGV